MKQYTTPEQTAKLIEQGFEKPKSRIDGEIEETLKVIAPLGEFEIPISNNCPAYSIGELIEMLPTKIEDVGNVKIMQITSFNGQWRVKYAGAPDAALVLGDELIDALYDMVVQLKEEGVI